MSLAGLVLALCLPGWTHAQAQDQRGSTLLTQNPRDVRAAASGARAPQGPMSAIDWLSDSVTLPVAAPPRGEAAVTGSAATETISVQSLDGPDLSAVGLIPAARAGLPPTLWGNSTVEALVPLVSADRSGSLPAIREMVRNILLAELQAPAGAVEGDRLLAARIDGLLRMGALDAAAALLDRSGTPSPDLFRRWFDILLLQGTEDAACTRLGTNPDIAPSVAARVFCLARNGDWDAAALTLDNAEALGEIDASTALVLAHFLDPALTDATGAPPLPDHPSPLMYRLAEAIGEHYTTAELPRAFAHADLRSTTGWKAQIEAAERLARAGAIPDNQLLGLYTQRRPAASGGIWDRVAAIQALDTGLSDGDADAVAEALPAAWDAAESSEIEVTFARLFHDRLARMDLPDALAPLVLRIGLLSPDYETVAQEAPGDGLAFARGVARGNVDGLRMQTSVELAIQRAFTRTGVPERFQQMLAEKRLGEAILTAADLFDQGAVGDLAKLTDALQLFRAAGLEDDARQAALQMLLLERRG